MKLIVNTDGASRGNPGPASFGYVIKSNDGVIRHQEGKAIGVATNNIAEYSAVLSALEFIRDHFSHKAPHEIEVVADSQLVVRQLSGLYKIKNLPLKHIAERIKLLEFELGRISYTHVPRAQNFIADRLANKALDEV